MKTLEKAGSSRAPIFFGSFRDRHLHSTDYTGFRILRTDSIFRAWRKKVAARGGECERFVADAARPFTKCGVRPIVFNQVYDP